jgi:NAD(P)H-flavin reductase
LPWQRICVGDKNVVAIATVIWVAGCHGKGFVSETKNMVVIATGTRVAGCRGNGFVLETKKLLP